MKAQIQETGPSFLARYQSVRDDHKLRGTDRYSPNVEYVESEPAENSEKVSIHKHLATLAHEIKNPLASICLSHAYLTAEVSNPDILLYLNIIERSTKRINEIVVSFLEESFETRSEQVSANDFLNEVIDAFEDKITLGGVVVERDFSADAPVILVAREKFKMAVSNIILNAIEALPSSGGRLKIKSEAVGKKCRITIADNGCGMSKEELQKIFRMGYTNKPGGSGIGLAITKEILDEHQAVLKVRSKPGKGTSFTIELSE